MLTLFARVAGLAAAAIAVHEIRALSVVLAWSRGALVDVYLTGGTRPARMTDALVAEQLVHADAIEAGIAGAKVDLVVAAFAGETGRTVAAEIGNQVCAVGAQVAWLLRAIVGVDLAALALPTGQTVALVAALLKCHAGGPVVAGIAGGGAWIDLRAKKNQYVK